MPSGSWVSRHKWWTAIIVVCVVGWAGPAGADDSERVGDRDPDSTVQAPTRGGVTDATDTRARPTGQRRTRTPRATPSPEPAPQPAPTYLVTRVIDGDTLELGNGEDVRLVGIDTPEVGECGYEKATAGLAALVEGRQVRLTRSDEARDRYGRLLRYVDIGEVDAGLRLIKRGLAVARYDSRDGYGFHRREPVYVAADRATPNVGCPKPQPLVSQQAPGACAPGYSPCVPPYPPDVDCADVDGPVHVTGTDPHGLDADGDGIACE